MPQIPIYQVDAFTSQAFGGNPAAVCLFDEFPSDDLLQAIAIENNLSETAFLARSVDDTCNYHLRWFTPGVEVALCGHATMAAAHVVFHHLRPATNEVRFQSMSGVLTVRRDASRMTMDFPCYPPQQYNGAKDIGTAMGKAPASVLKSEEGDRDLLLVYDSAETVANLKPDMAELTKHAPFGFIATAPGYDDVDFVSRCFFPNHGLGEDPVTGSAHCVSGPYWAKTLGKQKLRAKQISTRGGDLWLDLKGNRIFISGQAIEILQGRMFVPDVG